MLSVLFTVFQYHAGLKCPNFTKSCFVTEIPSFINGNRTDLINLHLNV